MPLPRLPFPWDTTPKDAPQRAGRSGQPSLLVGVRNVPSWLVPALELQSQEVPNKLDVSAIRPYTDAYQNGWGVARFRVDEVILNAATSSAFQIPARDDIVARVIGLSVASGVFAADRGFSALVRNLQSTVTGPAVLRADIPASVQRGWAELSLGTPIIIPPGYTFFVQAGLVAAETLAVRTLWAEAPAGFSLAL